MSVREAFQAGTAPKAIPVSSETPMVQAMVRQSAWKPKLGVKGMGGRNRCRASPNQRASSSPSAPPASDSNRLSISSSRRMRPRPAPSAARMPSSLVRLTPRASSRLATLAQAISSTRPAMKSATARASFTLP